MGGVYRCISPVNHTCGDCPYQDNHVECVRRVLSDAISLLKEQEAKVIVEKWCKNPLGDYLRLYCPWCDRELDRTFAREYVACPYCGKKVKVE